MTSDPVAGRYPGRPGATGPDDAAELPPSGHPARLDVGVVGAGRVGTALAVALSRAGHRISGASAVSKGSRDRVGRFLPGTPVLQPEEVVAGADLVLLTVPDDALSGLVRGLAATGAPVAGRCSLTPAAGTGWRCFSRPRISALCR